MKTDKISLKKEVRRLKEVIAMKCLDCVCCQPKEVIRCEIPDCPLWKERPKKLEGLYILVKKLKKKNPDFYG